MPTCSRAAALTTKALAQGAAVSASFRLKGRCFCTETQTARAGAGRGRPGGGHAWVPALQHSPCPEARSALRSATPAASEPRPPHEQGPGPPSFPEVDAEMDQAHCGRCCFPQMAAPAPAPRSDKDLCPSSLRVVVRAITLPSSLCRPSCWITRTAEIQCCALVPGSLGLLAPGTQPLCRGARLAEERRPLAHSPSRAPHGQPVPTCWSHE